MLSSWQACEKTCYQRNVIEQCKCTDAHFPSSNASAFNYVNVPVCSTANITQGRLQTAAAAVGCWCVYSPQTSASAWSMADLIVALPENVLHLHLSTPPENWTVRAFLQLTPRLSNDFTAAWLTFTFPQLFALAATLKSIDYNVAMTLILNTIIIIIHRLTQQASWCEQAVAAASRRQLNHTSAQGH